MDKKRIEVEGNAFCVPDYYQQVDSTPEDPANSVALMVQTEQSLCFVLAHHISQQEAMPYDQARVIGAVHGLLQENQGLIEVESGMLNGMPYVYSIVKNLNMNGEICLGVQYILAMDIADGNGATHFQGQFDEVGTTGLRDSLGYELCRREGLVTLGENGLEGWSADPYDPKRAEGTLMNLSEKPDFDKMFPVHPLSMARTFVACVLGFDPDGRLEATKEESNEKPQPKKRKSLFNKAGKFFGGAAQAAGDAASAATGAAGAAAGVVAEFASDTAGKVTHTAGDAASAAVGAAAGVRDVIGGRIEEVKTVKDEPDEYDRAVIAYNMAYTDLSDAGLSLHGQRVRAIDLMEYIEELVNSIANHPKSFDNDMGEVSAHKHDFKEAEAFAREELVAARKSATSASAGVAAGMAVASMAPSAALWVATTFGTASTGTAISTLSGAAATKAALAWLGGGAVAAGGGGTAAGSALLAMAGPIGWGIAGATLLASIVLFTKKKFDLRDEKQKELTAVKVNTEKVSEMAAEVDSLLAKTEKLHGSLSELFGKCMVSYGADFSKLVNDEQDNLAAMVNNTLSLSRLLNEQIVQAEPEIETEAGE